MLQCSRLMVSEPEHELIKAIKKVKYGEIYGVDIDDEEAVKVVSISGRFEDLINLIRDGAQYIDVLHVHDGEPMYAEIDSKINGFSCRTKIKFPTE